MRFLDILAVLRLDLEQISFNLVENTFATQQLALQPLESGLQHFGSGMPRSQNFEVTYVFRLFDFCYFFPLSFFSFSFLFAAVIDLLLSLLAVKKLLRRRHRGGQFLPWSSRV